MMAVDNPISTFASISVLLSIFLISSPVFVQSFALPSAIGYGGTKWVNNIQSLDSWILQSAGPCQHTVRPILLSKNISYGGETLRFGCGFFCDSNPCDMGYSFAVFFVIYQANYSDPDDLQMVWTANREHLVQENATLELTSTGDLVLKDSDGSLVWSTSTSAQGIMMEETGNLVLFNSSNRTMWQSFDHPADMLLLGQKLKVGQKLIANISPTNTSQGFYYGSLNVDGIALYTATQMYYRYPKPPTNGSIAYIQIDNESLNFYSDDFLSNQISIPKNSLYVKIDSNGHLQFYSFQPKTGNSFTDYLSGFTNELNPCEYPRTCGDYGICTDGQCSCPKEANAFSQIDSYRATLGCVLLNPLVCPETFSISSSPQDYELLEIDHVSYFAYLYENASTTGLVSRDECKDLCLKNCSCKAAFFRYNISTSFSSGYCYLESNVYSMKIDRPRDRFYNSNAYIKFQRIPKHPNQSVIVISIGVCTGLFLLFLLLGAWIFKSGKCKTAVKRDELEDDDASQNWPAGLISRFSFRELEKATNNFSRKLGSGGFGTVYEGALSDGTKIAVKRLDRAGQGTKQFKAEVETVGSIHHLNLVRLKGFCAEESHRMLVYEHLPNGSLDKWIFPNDTDRFVLDWKTRSKIVLHIARGLAYLHEECEQRIIHFDIKPQNILLDENFNAKVSDFGLAKLTNREQSEVITMLRGTPGYMAPELLSMHISEKADIFSFGVVLVEIVSGKRSRQLGGHRLFSVLQSKAEEGKLTDLLDSSLKYEADVVKEEAERVLRVGMLCIQDDYMSRPAMSIVVKVLEDMTELDSFPCSSSPVKHQPFLPSQQSPNLEFSYTADSSKLSGR
ncbi:G-type lectin S-receptor-like serine/threonine-protein kinase SD2-5 [Cryptomeria japonica]|uniref:G-type lectin S-receptor-like serine/threonine-protein kinase SD2-5 n=1 Tax=Cryptomeria japonica TaxID=3369 RepID=UPI0025AB6CC7|nr:G-type lectin S-receptor-like serine/threonine-protein kinase SD2-5 [Cryptomeria japonica]